MGDASRSEDPVRCDEGMKLLRMFRQHELTVYVREVEVRKVFRLRTLNFGQLMFQVRHWVMMPDGEYVKRYEISFKPEQLDRIRN